MKFGIPEILLILLAIVLLFGASRLPQLARSLGQTRKAFKEGFQEAEDDAAGTKQIDAKTAKPSVSLFTDEEILAEMERRAASRS